MKKTIFLGLAMLFATLSFAQNNRSAAEVFLQITKPGKYTVYLDDEVIGSATGRFRFYDVYNSKPELSIIQGDRLILKERINVNAQERLILGFDNGRLNVIKQLSLFRNNQYALDDFYDYTENLNTAPIQPTLADLNYRLLSPEAFQEFYTSYKKSSFDSERVRLINAVNKKASFSSSQCKLILKAFTFDTERSKTAKSLYQTVVDPQNYFTIAEIFEFFNYKDDFLKYLEKQ
ncbi:DUF4476 domain-containing protein [Pedobacter kyonggii]|uniref:DUF4476 domain-containing protein n=1 Tax=Pedobacter kyonggii TaxID=1926871 RepID=A0A4Q9HEN9_9SPHI|nr:DUF4476 domain-containing protein [Pedobacter kyonggii]TBO43264.1 DUF4476 domain-containing protein [Pedobacter kyonggii]